MKILGIMWEENSTAALFVDGKMVAAVSEERFSGQKNDERYPKNAIEYVLREGGIKAEELDYVAFAGRIWNCLYVLTRRYSTFSPEDRLREQKEYWYPMFYQDKKVHYLDIFKSRIDKNQYPGSLFWDEVIAFMNSSDEDPKKRVAAEKYFQDFRRKVVSGHLGISQDKIIFIDHHTAHAAHAFYVSPRAAEQEVLVLTGDAWGDDANATISLAKAGKIKRIAASNNFRGAQLYRYITQLLGMKPDQDEYKVMGLAPYGKSKYYQPAYDVFAKTQYVDGLKFAFKEVPTDLYFYFKDRLEGMRFDNISAGLQAYVQDLLVKWTKNAIEETGIKNIRFGGGVAMNVKAMMEIAKLPGVEIFVPPSPSDESTATGSIYALVEELIAKNEADLSMLGDPWENNYLGPDVDNNEVAELLKREKVAEKFKVIAGPTPSQVAELLVEGKIIARCVGRSEFGPRALGNRSIIADPRDYETVRKINRSIKNRDFWMPFAASVLEERANDYLLGYKKHLGAPYMTVAFDTTPLGRKHLKAGLHPEDSTCRPQVLKAGQNPGYEAIIKEFEKLTGVGAVLNTSFNLHGEPIVQSAKDAYRVFCNSDIDGLLFEKYLIVKK